MSQALDISFTGEDGVTLTVKNTFLDIENPTEDGMRLTKSVPCSFKTTVDDSRGRPSVNVLDLDGEGLLPSNIGRGTPGAGGGDVQAAAPSADDKQPALQHLSSMGASRGFRARAVVFSFPPNGGRALVVKNTFLSVDDPDDDEAPVRPTKSAPVCSASEAACGEAEEPSGDASDVSEASPARRQLRPEGPNLGLLWAPAGRAWGFPWPPGPVPTAAAPATPAPRPKLAAAPQKESSSETPLALSGSVWELSQDAQGCREVQRALDESTDGVRWALVRELEGHVWDAIRSPHANYVMQKCIATMPAEALQFIVDELPPKVAVQAARNKYGCRVVQRLVEKCPEPQVHALVDALLADLAQLARHPYGNYVAQSLLEHAGEAQRRRGLQLVAGHIRVLAADPFGCTVVGSALSRGQPEGRLEVARALLREPGLLVFTACTRHGHVAAARVLEVLCGPEREEARRRLSAEAESLGASRFGRLVVACL